MPILRAACVAYAARRLNGASAEAIKAVEDLKPYKRGDDGSLGDELLFTLHELDRFDKHRLIVPVGAIHTETAIRFAIGTPIHKDFRYIGPPIVAPNQFLVPIDGRKPVAEVDDVPLPPETNLHCKVTFEILFGDRSGAAGKPVAKTLSLLGEHVDGIVKAFEARFFR